MNFVSFLILLIISIVVTLVVHFIMKVYVRPGIDSLISTIILGWIGAWQGSAVFGQWFANVKIEGIFLIPAILGSFALLILMVDMVKTFKAK